MRLNVMVCIVGFIVSGCAFSDTAKIEALVLDEITGEPLHDVEVIGSFSVNHGWRAWKGYSGPNVSSNRTDKSGRCRLSNETNRGEAGCYGRDAPDGYYDNSCGGGYTFKHKDIFGVWQPDNLVVTLRVQRIVHPIPLFVKKVGQYGHDESSEDLFTKSEGVLHFDLMKGEWLPPIGKGEVADVEFKRLPREDFGEDFNGAGVKGRSYKDSMLVRFIGADNGLVEVATSASSKLKIRSAPLEGYTSEYLCWNGPGKALKWGESYDKNRCFCFRIRTRRDEEGKVVEAYYGKIYGDIRLLATVSPHVPVASVRFTYYLNPKNLDRNLEWNKQNLCDDPFYPRSKDWRACESFGRDMAP